MPAAGEPVDVTDIADQPGGARRADTVELQEVAAGGLDEFGQLRVRGLTGVIRCPAGCRCDASFRDRKIDTCTYVGGYKPSAVAEVRTARYV